MEAEAENAVSVILCHEDAEKFKKLPQEHKSRIFKALENHFSKFNDLLKIPKLSEPQKDDL